MSRKWGFLLGLVLLASACNDSAAETTADTLLTTTVATTTTTVASTATTLPPGPTTTAPPAPTTTSTTTAAPATTSTTVPMTEVAGAGDGDTADTLIELPFTGAEPEVALVALLALLLGVWLVQHAGEWQMRLARQEARWWRRPGAPSAHPFEQQSWPPNALIAVTDADRQFRHQARSLADQYSVSFIEGVDAYATRWVASIDLSVGCEGQGDDAFASWQAHMIRQLRQIYRAG